MNICYKRFLLWLLLATLFSGVKCLTHNSPSRHYTIKMGDNWQYIADEAIRRGEQETFQITGQRLHYSAGFKLKNSEDFKYPYILLQENDRKDASMKDLEKYFKTSNLYTDLEETYPGYGNILDNVELNKPYADKAKGIIYVVMISDVANIGRIAGLSGMVFGKHDVVMIHCYALERDFNTYYSQYKRIIESCQFDPGYSYSGLTKAMSESGVARRGGFLSELLIRGGTGLIAGALFGLVAFLVYLVSWLFKKKPKPHSYGSIDFDTISIDELRQRLDKISDINEVNNTGTTALMKACLETTDIDKIKLLLDRGGDVNVESREGLTAFIVACGLNTNLDVARLLRNHVKDIEKKTKQGRTALSFAAECNENIGVINYLLEQGADINSLDNSSRTPLGWACATGEIEDNILFLIEKDADVTIKDSNGYSAYKHIKANAKLKSTEARRILKEMTGAWV